MKRLLILFTLILSACDSPPVSTVTPTRDIPPLDASPTFDIRPPTPIPDDFAILDSQGFNNPTAAALPNEAEFLPQTTLISGERPSLITINTVNGTPLNGEWYPSLSDTLGPGVLLIGGPLDDWAGFPVILQNAGFTVLLVESRLPMLPGDFSAMIDRLTADPTVDAQRIAVIGASTGADAALIGCSQEPRCDLAVLLSPGQRDPLVQAMTTFNPRPLFLAASADDPTTSQIAQELRTLAQGEAFYQSLTGVGHGTQILKNAVETELLIVEWLIGRFNAL
ncbi:MAG: hypothetical protein MUF87_20515 [Anaerolineae bacterium]|jgi:hypothetical protein|nr:hypothetical protein [Anaerolineae bacterium]